MSRTERQDHLDTTSNYATGINDLQFEKNIKQQRLKEQQEQMALERMEKKEARKEKIKLYKQTSTPIYKIKKSFILTSILCFILGLIALTSGFIFDAIFSIFSGLATIIVGQNLRFSNTQPKLTNTILYNLSTSIKNFIDYKIPYEIFENEERWMDMFTVLGMFAFVILQSSNPLYGMAIIMICLVFLIAFAMNDIESINSHTNVLITACFIGIIVKLVYQYIYMGMIDIDFANIVLINIFSILSVFTKDLKITKP